MNTPFRKRPKTWSQPLADLVRPNLKPAFARFGFDDAALLLSWPDIVGQRLAARCEPLRLQWPPRRPGRDVQEPATLVVRVDGAFAIELQHQAPTVVERLNAHVGWRCVGRLALRQGPPPTRPTPPRPLGAPPAAATIAARAVTRDVADVDLRDALTRLGARVIAAKRGAT